MHLYGWWQRKPLPLPLPLPTSLCPPLPLPLLLFNKPNDHYSYIGTFAVLKGFSLQSFEFSENSPPKQYKFECYQQNSIIENKKI